MANEYYNASGYPVSGQGVTSSPMRDEFNSIESGAMKLPQTTLRNLWMIFVNAAASALDSLTASVANTKLGSLWTGLKDSYSGYVGLTAFKINSKNTDGSITSFIKSDNTAERTFTFPDKSGYILLNENTQNASLKNLLPNGDLNIWQMGTSIGSGGWIGGCADMWGLFDQYENSYGQRETFTLGQTDVPDNPKYYLSLTVSELDLLADSYTALYLPVENVRTLAGEHAVLTFYVKSDLESDFTVEGVQVFGAAGTGEHLNGIGNVKLTTTTLWAKKEVHFDFPSITGKTIVEEENCHIAIVLWLSAGTNYNSRSLSLGLQNGEKFYFAHAQLERGSVSTAFERRHVGVDMALCQRYFSTQHLVFSGPITSTKEYRNEILLPVSPWKTFPDSVAMYSTTQSGFTGGFTAGADHGVVGAKKTATSTINGGYWTGEAWIYSQPNVNDV